MEEQEVAQTAPGIVSMILVPEDGANRAPCFEGCNAPCECDCDCIDGGPADDPDYE